MYLRVPVPHFLMSILTYEIALPHSPLLVLYHLPQDSGPEISAPTFGSAPVISLYDHPSPLVV